MKNQCALTSAAIATVSASWSVMNAWTFSYSGASISQTIDAFDAPRRVSEELLAARGELLAVTGLVRRT